MDENKYSPTSAEPIHASPLVSVIMPAYNAQAFIAAALRSVLDQSYRHLEIIVVDDGSTDRTAEIVASITQQDSRVRLLRQKNAGVAAARNHAIKSSKGEFIAPLDADDIWYPLKIEKQVERMRRAGPNVGLIYTWLIAIDEHGSYIGSGDTPELSGDVYAALIYRNFMACASTPLIRRACLERVGNYNTDLVKQNAQGSEDYDLYLRIAEHYDFLPVNERLVKYRKHQGNMSSKHASMMKSHFLALADARKRRPDMPAYLYRWAACRYYLYLEQQSKRAAHHGSAIAYLCKAAINDVGILRYREFRGRLLSNMKRLVTTADTRSALANLRFPAESGQMAILAGTDYAAPRVIVRNDARANGPLQKLHESRLRAVQQLRSNGQRTAASAQRLATKTPASF